MAETKLANIDLSEFPYINKGLEGVVAFSTEKSFIDGAKGELIYAGYNITTLAEHATFEEVCYLLWHERLPNQTELDTLQAQIVAERDVHEAVITYVMNAPKDAEPMSVLRTATSMLSDFDKEAEDNSYEANMRKSIRLTAKMPALIAAFERNRQGKPYIAPLKEGSIAESFLYQLNGERPGKNAIRVMDLCLVLHAEHGMNASTFTARAITSTLSDIYSAVTGAIGSLKGPLHGGANTAVMEMLLDLKATGKDAKTYILDKLEKKEKVMGFGHRVYKTFDPRAHHLRTLAKALSIETGHQDLYDWSETILTVMKEEKNIDPNVDFFSATVYYSMGIMPDQYTCIFAMSRVSGWTAHFLEQMANNRLLRPRALYTGEKNLDWVTVDKR